MDFPEDAHAMAPGGFLYPFGAFLFILSKKLIIEISKKSF
jgi:hypothetical protein